MSELPYRRECYICGDRLTPIRARVALCLDCSVRYATKEAKAPDPVPIGETDDRTPCIVVTPPDESWTSSFLGHTTYVQTTNADGTETANNDGEKN
jgi:hypothetical protein